MRRDQREVAVVVKADRRSFSLSLQVSGSLAAAAGDETRDESPEEDVGEPPAPPSPPAISLLSPRAMETAGRIIRFQEEQREKAKVRLFPLVFF